MSFLTGTSDCLPEYLCYTHPTRAPFPSKQAILSSLPARFDKNNLATRDCALLCIVFGGCQEIISRWVELNTRNDVCANPPKQRLMTRFSMKAMRFREANCILTPEIILGRNKQPVGRDAGHISRVVEGLRSLTVDQWFFGITGDIDLNTWLFSPPVENFPRHLGRQRGETTSLQITSVVPATRYSLPIPMDLPTNLRTLLNQAGSMVPSFSSWLQNTPGVLRKFYPRTCRDFIQDRKKLTVWTEEIWATKLAAERESRRVSARGLSAYVRINQHAGLSAAIPAARRSIYLEGGKTAAPALENADCKDENIAESSTKHNRRAVFQGFHSQAVVQTGAATGMEGRHDQVDRLHHEIKTNPIYRETWPEAFPGANSELVADQYPEGPLDFFLDNVRLDLKATVPVDCHIEQSASHSSIK